MGARVTGQDKLVTTYDKKTEKSKKEVSGTRQVRKTVKKTPAKAGRSSDEPKYVTINFNDVDILVFIKFISELTGKNFVINKGITEKVTIVSPKKISVSEAYKVFESVLEVHGLPPFPPETLSKLCLPGRQKRKILKPA